jgi:hypothetical protein
MMIAVSYLFIGAVMVGLGLGLHNRRCPNDRESLIENRIELATWPIELVMGVAYFSAGGQLPACEK